MAVFAGIARRRARAAEIVAQPHLVPAERAEPHRVGQHGQPAGPGDPQHLPGRAATAPARARRRWRTGRCPRWRRRTATPYPRRGRRWPSRRSRGPRASRPGRARRRCSRTPASSKAVGEVAGAAADVEHGAAGRRLAVGRLPQVADHRDGVIGECGVEPGRVGLLEAELATAAAPTGTASPAARTGRWRP